MVRHIWLGSLTHILHLPVRDLWLLVSFFISILNLTLCTVHIGIMTSDSRIRQPVRLCQSLLRLKSLQRLNVRLRCDNWVNCL